MKRQRKEKTEGEGKEEGGQDSLAVVDDKEDSFIKLTVIYRYKDIPNLTICVVTMTGRLTSQPNHTQEFKFTSFFDSFGSRSHHWGGTPFLYSINRDNEKKVSGSGGKLITQVRLWLMLLQYRKRHLVRLIINLIHNAEWRLLLYSLHEACGNETAAAAGVSAKKRQNSCLHTITTG